MSPFTCTQTLHYVFWGKLSLTNTCNLNQIISWVVHFENQLQYFDPCTFGRYSSAQKRKLENIVSPPLLWSFLFLNLQKNWQKPFYIQLHATDQRLWMWAVCDTELKDGWLQHLWLRKMNNRNTQKKVDTWKKTEKKGHKTVSLERKTFSTGFKQTEEQEGKLLVKATANSTPWFSNKPVAISLQYIQLSVNPMRDQAVHPEK